ncbi:MAG TPA: nitrophenyl compound nitroreductase subunit ArsF family protein [Bacteroidales bacterium]|nr:nitrophenyl compound nitroreductase subunit ArsF family protein [Bacteroidales bacterium]HQN15777.1 nitrophenyl compound nitroreductase subunit ArsF family protein [Bacteroidales bacterium]HQP15197.1 nitrophenyl compound nitroreductase subunit ArsF family protein [Bacteroidales bacterium]
MKKTVIISFLLLFSVGVFSQKNNDTIIANNAQNLRLKVFYFHITNRCNTCFSIEKYVRQTIDNNFANQLELGIVDLYILNCELPENRDLVKKYDAYGATLALTSYSNGKEEKSEDLTGWAFKKVHEPNIFISELKAKIEESIK